MPSNADLPVGFAVGPYTVEAVRAVGGYAAVYRARHATLGRTVALKVLHRHLAAGSILQRFEREARTVNRIQHPNIVDIVDISELPDGSPYCVMEWVDGPNLAELLAQHGPFDVEEALAILEDIGAAIGAAHDIGVVHRDLKASNVLAQPAGDGYVYKLTDFGIAKLLEPDPIDNDELTKTGVRMGTPTTMSPEQILRGGIDHRADLYTLGLLLVQLLTGRLPFRGATDLDIEEMHLRGARPLVSAAVDGVSAAVDGVIHRCLDPDPEGRFDSAPAMLAALRRAIEAGASRSYDAVGLRVEITDAEALDEIAVLARRACGAAGLDVALDAANLVLGVAPAADARDRAEEAARTLRERVGERAVVTVRVDRATSDHDGPLFDLSRWPT